jgi:hypothetical protein
VSENWEYNQTILFNRTSCSGDNNVKGSGGLDKIAVVVVANTNNKLNNLIY